MPNDISEIISAIVAGIIVLVVLIIFIISFLLIYYRRYHRHILEKQQLQAKFEQQLLTSELETLQQISQEIHDNVGQVLSLARINLSAIDINKPEIISQQVAEVENLVARAAMDLQRLAKSMNPGYIEEMGLLRCIEYELETIRNTGKYTARLEVAGDLFNKLNMHEELILYRITQEVINNILKHASATSISVQVTYLPENFALIITDNGKGFDPELLQNGKNGKFGLGIRNMRNRAGMIGADVMINSITGTGTIVKICLPASTRITNYEKK